MSKLEETIFLDVDSKTKSPKMNFLKLFKYASKRERLLFIVGVLFSIGVGALTPVSFLLFSDIINDFTGTSGATGFEILVQRFAMLGAGTFVLAYFQMLCIQLASRMQARRIRKLLFTQVLNQDVAWFDENSVGKVITQLTEGVDKIEAGCGEKLSVFVQFLVMFVGGIIIGYTRNWKLSLVGSAIFPLVAFSIVFYSYAVSKYTKKEREAYSVANSIASEILGAVKTILAFEGQNSQLERYSSNLHRAEKLGIKKSTLSGLTFGMIDASLYFLLAVCLYYGIVLLIDGPSLPGDVVLVIFAMLIGGITIGQAFQQIEHFNNALTAAAEIYPVIDNVPTIDKTVSGTVLSQLEGNILFKDVSFEYPLRNDVRVLNKVNIYIPAGKTVAIVGPSGSGKSTVIQLIQRFYDANEGDVSVDGVNIRDLNLISFRAQLGVVSQEPVLFAATVTENIRLGRPDATQEEIEKAAKLARAHDFISKLPEGYDTFIAEGGGGMSGGQKQRIAIARALIRNPRILLLDEATSALDTKSEKAVQKALNSARKGRTVVIVAHRLTTIRDADTILVMDGGVVREQGTHDELMALKGIYAKLVNKSGIEEDEGDGDVKRDDDDDEDDDVENIIKLQEKTVDKQTKKRLISFDKQSETFRGDDVSSVQSFFSSPSNLSFIDVETQAKINVGKEVLFLNKPEMCYLVVGCLMSAANGIVKAAFAVVYTELYGILGMTNSSEQLDQAARVAGALGGLAALRLLCGGIGDYCMGVSGERLTKRCRIMLFKAMLRQEPGWFDEQENQPGILTGRLAADVPMLQNVSGRKLGSMMEMFVLVVSALIIAFYFSWQIALVALAFFPILGIVGFFQMRQMKGEARINVKGAGVATECLNNARTVFSLGAENHFIDSYEQQALLPVKQLAKGVTMFSLVSAIANSLMNFQFAALFYAGGKLMAQEILTLNDVFKAFTAISFAASNLGYIATFAPDSKKAEVAGQKIFELINREPALLPDEGEFPDKPFQGAVAFNSVTFAYPTRKKTKVLRAFSYDVQPGKNVAFVGQSGCGKSTLLQLVQRFYDPTVRNDAKNFGVTFDGMNLQTLAPNWIRRQIGVVSQEPNLIDMTIRENIAFGLNYQEEKPSMEAIIEAAKQANAHKFIEDFPEGYDTPVGPRGTHLSGGQKQRIAIARALIRNPRLLLLDEATAALDNESERVVQAALDEAMKAGERTTLVVAHRLTTVDKCDLIVVVEGGKCVESGAPDELMASKGKFYELNNADVNIKRE